MDSILIWLGVISLVLAFGGLGLAMWRTKEFPKSVTALAYKQPDSLISTVWPYWLAAVTFTLTPPVIERMVGSMWQFLGFLLTVFLLACVVFRFTNAKYDTEHRVAGLAAGILSQLCVIVICPWWLLTWVLLVALAGCLTCIDKPWVEKMFNFLEGKGVFVLELLCMIALYGSVLLS